MDDYGDDFGYYEEDDLEAFGQQESFEHVMSEREADYDEYDEDGYQEYDDPEDDRFLDAYMEGRMMGEY